MPAYASAIVAAPDVPDGGYGSANRHHAQPAPADAYAAATDRVAARPAPADGRHRSVVVQYHQRSVRALYRSDDTATRHPDEKTDRFARLAAASGRNNPSVKYAPLHVPAKLAAMADPFRSVKMPVPESPASANPWSASLSLADARVRELHGARPACAVGYRQTQTVHPAKRKIAGSDGAATINPAPRGCPSTEHPPASRIPAPASPHAGFSSSPAPPRLPADYPSPPRHPYSALAVRPSH